VSADGFRALAKRAARRYPPHDRFARHFAYFKLTGDPAFRHLLENGLLRGRERLLDLGCGQGMLEALLAAARQEPEAWPSGWPPPPVPRTIRGIELDRRAAERARTAADERTTIDRGDIRALPFGAADAIVILDVLHYIEPAAQDSVLERVRAALAPGGVLLLRVADARPTLRFRVTIAVDRLSLGLRGGRPGAYHCRPLEAWRRRLGELGFEVEARAMSGGTPFANVLLLAHAA
jgi:SAM-dependent methyltransferase